MARAATKAQTSIEAELMALAPLQPHFDLLLKIAASLREQGCDLENKCEIRQALCKDFAPVDVEVITSCFSLLKLMIGERSSGSSAVGSTSDPPRGFMLLLASVAQPGRAEEVLGDAEDEYRKIILRLGPRLAPWWYRVHVMKQVIDMLPGVLMRVLVLHKLFGL